MKRTDPDRSAAEKALVQHAALCFRHGTPGGETEILVITSRETGRWVLPKGWPIRRKRGSESALREAFEEAGVEGRACDMPVGVYSYLKTMRTGEQQTCVVSVYPVEVTRLHARFPERGQRRTEWVTPAEAAARVAEPELKAILAHFDPATLPKLRRKSG